MKEACPELYHHNSNTLTESWVHSNRVREDKICGYRSGEIQSFSKWHERPEVEQSALSSTWAGSRQKAIATAMYRTTSLALPAIYRLPTASDCN